MHDGDLHSKPVIDFDDLAGHLQSSDQPEHYIHDAVIPLAAIAPSFGVIFSHISLKRLMLVETVRLRVPVDLLPGFAPDRTGIDSLMIGLMGLAACPLHPGKGQGSRARSCLGS